ncbi:MAG TPA: VOC family protein [Acidimicrobiales bacterium]|nr:VOC family protein [Acidimicrobiales bacterium]
MGHPRFNHIALTVSPELLDGDGRAEVLDFYGDVFGWTEVTQMTEPGKVLVLQAHRFDQFVFLVGGETPAQVGARDHFGMSVDSPEALDAILERAKARAAADDRVTVIDKEVQDFGPVTLTSFYTGFRLPMMIEIQHFAFAS